MAVAALSGRHRGDGARRAGLGAPVRGWPFSTTPHCLALPLRPGTSPSEAPCLTCPVSNGSSAST